MNLLTLIAINVYGQQVDMDVEEISDMKYMVEEEKVARDVYEYLYKSWNLRVFDNISQSEQRHMDMMENLLNSNKVAYELRDERGEFYNKDLQKMYDDLIEKGSKSKQDALQVGKLIEETDIKDLEQAIKNSKNTYTIQVYSNLLRASQNHLQAFNRQL
jgi:hypothetical protein